MISLRDGHILYLLQLQVLYLCIEKHGRGQALETSISGNMVDHAAVYFPISAKSSRGPLGTLDAATDAGATVHVTFILRVKFNCEPRARSVN